MVALNVGRVLGGFFVQETGVRNGAFGADKFGLKNLKQVHRNLGAPQLYQYSLSAGEAVLSPDGSLCADTGEFTGRSPKDKFTVRDATTDKKMWWAGNQSITAEQFETLYQDFSEARRRQEAIRAGFLWRRRPGLPDQDARLHRARLALAVHPHAADPPRGGRAVELRAGAHHHRHAELPRRSEAPRLQVGERRLRSISPARSS